MSKQIVIARYDEDIDWIQELKQDYIIYDKTPDATPSPNTIILENHKMGREAHTILHHIVNNYFQLADQTTFLQADPFPHFVTKYPSMIEDLNSDYSTLFRPHGRMRVLPITRIEHYRMEQITALCNECLHIDVPDRLIFSWGAQFTINKDIIQLKPLKLYEKLYNMIEQNEVSAYAMEFVWCRCVFAPTNKYYKAPYWQEVIEYVNYSREKFPESFFSQKAPE